jgi:hypothetical protein
VKYLVEGVIFLKKIFIAIIIAGMAISKPVFATEINVLTRSEITIQADEGQDKFKEFKEANKADFEEVLSEKRAIRKEMQQLYEKRLGMKKESKEEMRTFIKDIKDRVDKGELTKEEGIQIIKDKRISDQEYLKNFSEEGKKELKAIDEKINEHSQEVKKLKKELESSIEEKDSKKMESAKKKYIDAMKDHNKLLKQKLEVIKKYSKR